jgi:hypothetical protein
VSESRAYREAWKHHIIVGMRFADNAADVLTHWICRLKDRDPAEQVLRDVRVAAENRDPSSVMRAWTRSPWPHAGIGQERWETILSLALAATTDWFPEANRDPQTVARALHVGVGDLVSPRDPHYTALVGTMWNALRVLMGEATPGALARQILHALGSRDEGIRATLPEVEQMWSMLYVK